MIYIMTYLSQLKLNDDIIYSISFHDVFSSNPFVCVQQHAKLNVYLWYEKFHHEFIIATIYR